MNVRLEKYLPCARHVVTMDRKTPIIMEKYVKLSRGRGGDGGGFDCMDWSPITPLLHIVKVQNGVMLSARCVVTHVCHVIFVCYNAYID